MLLNLLYTAILLGVLVFVHELGHFLVAKACGVKVLRFSIGFGPKVVGFTRGETEYRIAWVPLGGYVKMAGEQPGEELPLEEARRGFSAQAPWKRALIVLAGPAFNLIFPVAIYFLVFFGAHQAISTRIGRVIPGTPAAHAGLLAGDRILAVDGRAVHTFDDLSKALKPSYERQTTLSVGRDGKTFDVTLVPETDVEKNPLGTVKRGMIGVSPYPEAPVLGVPAGSAAAKAGLRTFDRVLTVDGQTVKDLGDLDRALAQTTGPVKLKVERDVPLQTPGAALVGPKIVDLTVPRQAGTGYQALGAEGIALYVSSVTPNSPASRAGIARGDELLALDGKPVKSNLELALAFQQMGQKPFQLTWRHDGVEKHQTLRLAPLTVKGELGQETHPLALGVHFFNRGVAEDAKPEMTSVHRGFLAAAERSLQVVPQATGTMVKGIGYLLIGKVPFKSVGGPVLIYQMTSKSAQAGLDSFLQLMALISINLGLVNLIPIPVLDGFALLAAMWEGVRRRPIPIRAREVANMIGLVMLIVIMVLALKNDLTR